MKLKLKEEQAEIEKRLYKNNNPPTPLTKTTTTTLWTMEYFENKKWENC